MLARENCKTLSNKKNSYTVLYMIGGGSYGTVSKCINQRTKEEVAIKTIHYRKDQKKEIKMVEALRELDPDESNIVRFIEHFKWAGHACLVFELLDWSLDDLVADRKLCPLTLNEIRPIAQQVKTYQVLTALDALHLIGIVHNDLKLDNIMLVNHEMQPYKVKLIDFGMAFKTSEAELYQGVEMQVLIQRAPEIILGHPVNEAVDLWSAGCILAQLFLATDLFQGCNEFEMMKHIVNVVGLPSDQVLDASHHADKFFVKSEHRAYKKWSLKSEDESDMENKSSTTLQPYVITCLDDLIDFSTVGENMDDEKAFVNLLKCLFQIDPEQRISAGRALNHSFVSMKHLMNISPSTLSIACTPEKKPRAFGVAEKKPRSFSPSEKTPSDTSTSTTGTPAECPPVKRKKTCLERICSFFMKVKNCLMYTNKFNSVGL